MNDVTRILSAIEQGDPNAAELLLPLVYDELRKLAAQKLAHEASGQTLQATALVHEAYLRLVDVEDPPAMEQPGPFAGEHCCYAFTGWMEGALSSGVRLARRLAERDGLVKPIAR